MENHLTVLTNQYKGKRVFVTGHTGFKGSWLLILLKKLGAVVKGYSLAPEANGLYLAIDGDLQCNSVIGDICNKEKFENELLSFQPDYLFHLAAQPLVRLSYELPSDTFMINAIGTSFVLEAVRKLNKPCAIVAITTDKVYENKEWSYAYRENDRLGGYDPYSASKACCEIIISSYRNSFFNPDTFSNHGKAIASVRAGNVIGGGDWAKDRLLPDIIRALQNGKPVRIRNPKSIRPWQHVLEPLIGYLLIGSRLIENSKVYSSAWNFGPALTDNQAVQDIVSLAIDAWGEGQYVVEEKSNDLHEAGILKLDISKTINTLRWVPKLNAQSAVIMTVNWYKAFIQGGKAAKLIERDIDAYFSL